MHLDVTKLVAVLFRLLLFFLMAWVFLVRTRMLLSSFRRDPRSGIGGLLLFGAFMGTGLSLGGRTVVIGLQTYAWPSTVGTITSSTVRHSARSGYQPLISYQYTVAGKTYFGEQIRILLLDAATRETAEAIQNQFPESAVVKVYYSPKHPEISVLLRGLNPFWNISFVIGVLCTAGLLFHYREEIAGFWLKHVGRRHCRVG